MNCATVRDLLPERAIGVGNPADDIVVDRHLVTCAACRKESGDLERAATVMAFALAPAEPPEELEGRVVGRLHALAGQDDLRRHPSGRRRSRRMTALVLAASLVIGGMGWVASANRASRGDQASAIGQRNEQAFDAFRKLIRKSEFSDPGTEVRLGLLAAPGKGAATGSAITILAPSLDDRVIVLLSGLPSGKSHLPYSVLLVSDRHVRLHVGDVLAPDTSGGATVARIFRRDLSGFTRIVVRDARGTVMVAGTLETGAPVASPGP